MAGKDVRIKPNFIAGASINGVDLYPGDFGTPLALYSAKQDRLISSMAGYFIITGCDITPSATSGKLDIATGYIGHLVSGLFFEKKVPAVTAIATKTIANLASDAGLTAGECVWCSVEIDPSGAVAFNLGTKAVVGSAKIPTVTVGNVGRSLIYVPYGATTVSQSTSGTTDAKLFDVGVIQSILPARTVSDDQCTGTLGNQTTLASMLTAHSTSHFPADSLRPGDNIWIYGAHYMINPTGGTATSIESKVTGFGQTLFDITTSSTVASSGSGLTANICRVFFDVHILITATTSAKATLQWRRTAVASASAGEQATSERYEHALQFTGTINLATDNDIDLLVRNTPSSTTAAHTLMQFKIQKAPMIP